MINTTKDPICGMNIDEKTAKYKAEYAGKTYYSCSPSCKAEFKRNPKRYAK